MKFLQVIVQYELPYGIGADIWVCKYIFPDNTRGLLQARQMKFFNVLGLMNRKCFNINPTIKYLTLEDLWIQ